MTSAHVQHPHVVVVGAGFGGLACAKALARESVRVTVVDRTNYHLFQPLLYQVATAEIGSEDVAHPARGILRRARNVEFRIGTVERVDWDENLIVFEEGGVLSFDFLVIAAGVTTSFPELTEGRERLFGLKTLDDAVALRSHVLHEFEQAAVDPSRVDRGALTVVIVGAGPTGVELAGAFAQLFRGVLSKDFPELPRGRVVLLEMADVLQQFHPALRRNAVKVLRRKGVDVRDGTRVVRTDPDIELETGEVIPARTIVWAGGVRGNPLATRLGVTLDRTGRVVVDPTLRIPEHPQGFVVGDLAATEWKDGKTHPLVAQVALQGGKHAAREILRAMEGQPARPFRYRDRGIMATIGRHAAVAQLPVGVRFRGLPAWLAWLFLHLVYLVGFRNKIHVLMNWIWAYLTGDLSARIIDMARLTRDQRPGEASLGRNTDGARSSDR